MVILNLIMTHKEALPTVERHLPIWENVGDEIIFASPVDSIMKEGRYCSCYPEVRIGEAEHNGEKSAQRIIGIVELALRFKTFDYLLLMEYDSFALSLPKQVMPDKDGVSAIRYIQNKPIKFKGKFYLHYPMLFTRTGLEKTYIELSRVKTNDRNFSDRFIGKAVELAGIPVKDLLKMKKGYSKNTIEEKHYAALKKAVKDGAVFFHGIKDEQTLKIITER